MKRQRHAFTVVELIMAVTITAIIGLAAAGVSSVLSSAYAHGENHYGNVATARNAMRQIQDFARKAQLVTAVNNARTSVAYWMGDSNEDENLNLLEFRVLRYEAEIRQIIEYRVTFPEEWSQATIDAHNQTIQLGAASSISHMETKVVGSLYCEARVVAGDVSSFAVTLLPEAPSTKLVQIKFTAGSGDSSLTLRSAAALRGDKISKYVGSD